MPEMPNLGLMSQAYAQAYILPVLDGGGNPANNKSNVAFLPNIPEDIGAGRAQLEGPNALESDANRSAYYWIAYLQSAYQGPFTDSDGDPDTELPWLGATPEDEPRKGSWVFLEVVRDFAHLWNWTPAQQTLYSQRNVLHESAHQFNVLDDPQGLLPPSVMHNATEQDLSNPEGSQFNEFQRLVLRKRGNSPGSVGP
jgi:hypothetical protein